MALSGAVVAKHSLTPLCCHKTVLRLLYRLVAVEGVKAPSVLNLFMGVPSSAREAAANQNPEFKYEGWGFGACV